MTGENPPAPAGTRHRPVHRWILFALVAVVVLATCYVLLGRTYPAHDGYRYLNHARYYLQHGTYPGSSWESEIRGNPNWEGPLYPLLLAGAKRVTGAYRAFHPLFLVGIGVLLMGLIPFSERPYRNLSAALFYLTVPVTFLSTLKAYKTLPLTFFMLASLFFYLRGRGSPRSSSTLVAVLLGVVAFLVEPPGAVCLLFIAVDQGLRLFPGTGDGPWDRLALLVPVLLVALAIHRGPQTLIRRIGRVSWESLGKFDPRFLVRELWFGHRNPELIDQILQSSLGLPALLVSVLKGVTAVATLVLVYRTVRLTARARIPGFWFWGFVLASATYLLIEPGPRLTLRHLGFTLPFLALGLGDWINLRSIPSLRFGVLMVMIAGFLVWGIVSMRPVNEVARARLDPLRNWLQAHTGPGTVLYTERLREVGFFGTSVAVDNTKLGLTTGDDRLAGVIHRRCDYVVLSEFPSTRQAYLRDLLSRHPNWFRPVQTLNADRPGLRWYIYEVHRLDPPGVNQRGGDDSVKLPPLDR